MSDESVEKGYQDLTVTDVTVRFDEEETSQNAISDPWRLCCPRCGGHSFRSFSNYWRCQTCDPDQWDTRIEKLKDKKTGRLLSRSEVAGGV